MNFDEELCAFIAELEVGFPELQLKQKVSANDEQILPNKLPLKRRLAEYRYSQSQGPGLKKTSNGNLSLHLSGSVGNLNATSNSPPPLPSTSKQFTSNLWALEKFRDITPAFVVVIFEDSIVFEPGDIGPLPMDSPIARELYWAINNQTLSPHMIEVLREYNAPWYDGSVVVGIVDYRQGAFGIQTGAVAGGLQGNLNNSSKPMTSRSDSINLPNIIGQGTSSSPTKPTVAPEMHKVLLRPSYASLVADVEWLPSLGTSTTTSALDPLELEAELLLATVGPLCLDPSPLVGLTMRALDWDKRKMTACLGGDPGGPSVLEPPLRDRMTAGRASEAPGGLSRAASRLGGNLAPIAIASSFLGVAPSSSRRAFTGAGSSILFTSGVSSTALPSSPRELLRSTRSSHLPRFRMISHVEAARARRADSEQREPMCGLDVKKDPQRYAKLLGMPPAAIFGWIQPHQRLWRTIRYELKCFDETGKSVDEKDSQTDTSKSNQGSTPKPLSSRRHTHTTIHLLYTALGHFDLVMRAGEEPFLGETIRVVRFAGRQAIEHYVEGIRRLMAMEGRTCVADISHAGVLGTANTVAIQSQQTRNISDNKDSNNR